MYYCNMESTKEIMEKTTEDELIHMNFCIDSLLLADQMMENEHLSGTNGKKSFLFGETNCKKDINENVQILNDANNNNTSKLPRIGTINKNLKSPKIKDNDNVGSVYLKNYPPNPNPDTIINDLYGLFDPNNQLHNHFKILCDLLREKKTRTNDEIKNILLNINYNTKMTVTKLYNKLMTAIYNRTTTDFALIFPDNKNVFCFKATLLTIPYFEMQFKDTQVNDSMNLISRRIMIRDLIELLHSNDTDLDEDTMFGNSFVIRIKTGSVSAIEYINMFKLMDEFLMKDHFYILLQYANKYIKSMTNGLITKNDYGNLIILYEILKNIAIEQLKNSEDCYFDENSDANKIIEKMFQSNMGNQINSFDGWQELIDGNYKSIAIILKEIHKNGDYESLNTLNILPRISLSFLAMINFGNNKYCDIFESVEANKATLVFGKKNVAFNNSIIMINSYYPDVVIDFHFPALNYIKITKMPILISHKKDNCVTIQLLDHFNKNIKTGAHIFFGKEIKTLNVKYDYITNNITIDTEYRDFGHYLTKSRNDYYVNSVLMCSCNNNICEKVNEAKYISPLFHNTQYKLLLDRKCDDNVDDYIWLIEHCSV